MNFSRGRILLLVSFFLLLVFTRFVNLEHTARFLWDESSDLVKIHQIFVDKQITLVGPISEDGNKVFGSLTYYLLLPFAIIGKFDPVSTAYGAAFWSVITGLLIFFLSIQYNRKIILWIIPLVLLWYPFLETGRWAWNPNFIPLWIAFGLVFYKFDNRILSLISGILFGLSIHQHYLAVFALAGFVLASFVFEKNKLKPLTVLIGITLSVFPFVLFDILHPPGLFLSRLLYFNHTEINQSVLMIFQRIINNFGSVLFYYTHNVFLSVFLGILISLQLLLDIRNKSKSLLFVVPWLVQIIAIAFIDNSYTHYFLPGLVFFLLWVIVKRNYKFETINKGVLLVLIIGSLYTFYPQLTFKNWESDIASTRRIQKVMESEVLENNLKNVNLAVLASPDVNTYGRKYRDLFLIDGIGVKSRDEYSTSDYLFVVSTSEIESVRKDPAYEMQNFRSGKLQKIWSISDSSWKVYLLRKNGL